MVDATGKLNNPQHRTSTNEFDPKTRQSTFSEVAKNLVPLKTVWGFTVSTEPAQAKPTTQASAVPEKPLQGPATPRQKHEGTRSTPKAPKTVSLLTQELNRLALTQNSEQGNEQQAKRQRLSPAAVSDSDDEGTEETDLEEPNPENTGGSDDASSVPSVDLRPSSKPIEIPKPLGYGTNKALTTKWNKRQAALKSARKEQSKQFKNL